MKGTTKKTVLTAMLFAVSIVLSWFEGLLPSFFPVPGIKLGLSNVVTMYALFFVNAPTAIVIALLKSGFVMLTRGVTAGFLSLGGGILSVGVMALCTKLGGSVGFASILGAVFHNIGQLAAAGLILSAPFLWYYIPILVLSGIVMGALTGAVLRLVLPAVSKLPRDD